MGFDFSGVITALVTPFSMGKIDYSSFSRLIASQIDAGIRGFVINGTTGESPTLTSEEVRGLLERARHETDGKVPLILGAGSNSTARTIENVELASRWGADAALLVVPYYNKPPQRGLVAHFRAVADSSRIPILLYNVPSRTITGLSLESIERLSRHPRIIGIKEASGDMDFDKAIIDRCGEGFLVTSGDDASCLELARLGGKGVISVASHIIGPTLCKLFQLVKSDAGAACKEYERWSPVVSALYTESNPIPVKAALKMLGAIESAELRLPLVELADEAKAALRQQLLAAGLMGEKT